MVSKKNVGTFLSKERHIDASGLATITYTVTAREPPTSSQRTTLTKFFALFSHLLIRTIIRSIDGAITALKPGLHTQYQYSSYITTIAHCNASLLGCGSRLSPV